MNEPVPSRPRTRWLGSAAVGCALVLLLFVLIPLLTLTGFGPRPVPPAGRCRFQLSHLGIALRQYHDDHGSYPPAYIADSDGKPMHSWRVLLLPYLHGGGYTGYNFDEPWDGPNNILLAKMDFSDFRCPAAAKDRVGFTNYVAVTGPGTVFDGPRVCRQEDITGDPAKIIMLVEIADSDIPWTAPRDLAVETANLIINSDRHSISSNHGDGVTVLFCAGSRVRFGNDQDRDCPRAEFLSRSTTPDQLKSMLRFHQDKR